MRNRQLFWIASVALGMAGVAAFLNSQEKVPPPQPSVAALEAAEMTRVSISPRVPAAPPVPRDPAELAVARLRELFARDPEDHDGQAAQLLNEYCQNGQFEIALKLLDAVPGDMRQDWLQGIFGHWAQHQPLAAMAALDSIADPEEREIGFRTAVQGWNSNDPAGLADYAKNLPSSDDRSYALMEALGNWSMQDPQAMAAWLNNLPRGDEYDYGVALMLTRSDAANRSPQLAMQWVENIGNPIYKQSSFARILAEWMLTDSAAAKQYVATASWLDDSARAKILGGL